MGALFVNLAEEQGSHDAPARADDPGRKPRGNCHHTKRRTRDRPSQPVRARTTVRLPPSARGRTDAAGADPRPWMRIRLCAQSLWGGGALALSARNGFFVRPGPGRLGMPPFFRGGTPSHPAPAGRERKRSVPIII